MVCGSYPARGRVGSPRAREMSWAASRLPPDVMWGHTPGAGGRVTCGAPQSARSAQQPCRRQRLAEEEREISFLLYSLKFRRGYFQE
jgi:hypothetical protein